MMDRKRPERTTYPRLQAPVYFTPAGLGRPGLKGNPAHDSLGVPLHIEVFLLDGSSVTCRAEVAWVDALGDSAPAQYDVGLRFTGIRPGDRERLSAVLAAACT